MKQNIFAHANDDDCGFAGYFRKCTNEELVEAFNREIDNLCWIVGKVDFYQHLGQEFLSRKFDCSSFIFGDYMSLMNRIRIKGKKIETLKWKPQYTYYDINPN